MLEDLPFLKKIPTVIKQTLLLPWDTEDCPMKRQDVTESDFREDVNTTVTDRADSSLSPIQEEKKVPRAEKSTKKTALSHRSFKVCKHVTKLVILFVMIEQMSTHCSSTGVMTACSTHGTDKDILIKCVFNTLCKTSAWFLEKPMSELQIIARDGILSTNLSKYETSIRGTISSLKIYKADENDTNSFYRCDCDAECIEQKLTELIGPPACTSRSSGRKPNYYWMVPFVILKIVYFS